MIGVGDVVVCVDDGPIVCARGVRHTGASAPKRGSVVRVESIRPFGPCGCPSIYSGSTTGLIHRFRKIKKAEDEFTALVRRCQPIKREVQA